MSRTNMHDLLPHLTEEEINYIRQCLDDSSYPGLSPGALPFIGRHEVTIAVVDIAIVRNAIRNSLPVNLLFKLQSLRLNELESDKQLADDAASKQAQTG